MSGGVEKIGIPSHRNNLCKGTGQGRGRHMPEIGGEKCMKLKNKNGVAKKQKPSKVGRMVIGEGGAGSCRDL